MSSNLNKNNSFTKQLFDLGPLIIFFITNYFYGIFWGTGALVVSTIISIILSKILENKIPLIAAFGCLAVAFFGSLTIIFQDEIFIKIKPTIVSVFIAMILLIGEFFGKQPIKIVMSSNLNLSQKGWEYLSKLWIIMFFSMAFANEIAWRNLSTDDWVTFKVFGIPILSIIFAFLSIPIITRFNVDDLNNNSEN